MGNGARINVLSYVHVSRGMKGGGVNKNDHTGSDLGVSDQSIQTNTKKRDDIARWS